MRVPAHVLDPLLMSRLIDTTICPDCRGALDAAATCTGCGLHLAGPLAGQLWTAMVSADRLVEQLRVQPSASRSPDVPIAPHAPAPAPPVAPARASRLPAASVPVVLLCLGALCLLVAAVVFIAVTWSVLGLTGRTLVLLGVTTGTFLLGLTGALLTVPVLAAANAGYKYWVGRDPFPGLATGGSALSSSPRELAPAYKKTRMPKELGSVTPQWIERERLAEQQAVRAYVEKPPVAEDADTPSA